VLGVAAKSVEFCPSSYGCRGCLSPGSESLIETTEGFLEVRDAATVMINAAIQMKST
jgi:hypothetical protein